MNSLMNSKNPDVFKRLIEISGLSPIFARQSFQLIYDNLGVDIAKLSKADIARSLPDIERVLQLFLHPREVQERLQAVKKYSAEEGE